MPEPTDSREALMRRALTLACVVAAFVAPGGIACTATPDIHQTDQAKSTACFDCHATAYEAVQTPPHVGVFPTTCGDCHATSAWTPAIDEHPEAKFPITTGPHANKAIGCADCHITSLGSDVGGQNTDCVHCHIGAHDTPAIDAVHAGVANYPGSMPTSPPTCLGCHPSG
jgi:hypothetical protein